MEEDLHKIWRCLRPTVKDGCTFAMIKDLVATSGLPVEKLSHLQQRSIHERGELPRANYSMPLATRSRRRTNPLRRFGNSSLPFWK